MKYIEKFTYWLLEQPIFEMAYHRKAAIDKIQSLSGTTLEHIIKLKCIKGTTNDNHWKTEIKSFFSTINRITLKPNNKKFTENEYMEMLFVEPYCYADSSAYKNIYNPIKDHIYNLLYDINNTYSTNIDYNDINFDEIILFFEKICYCMANNGNIYTIIDNEKW